MAELSTEANIQQIIQRYSKYRNVPGEIEKIKEAFQLANEVHDGQRRKTKHPFIIHPLNVAFILADLELDWEVICAALLHDTIEDTALKPDILIEKFGPGVTSLVDALTKIRKAFYAISEEDDQLVEIESIRKIIVGATQDVRVILIKLADRWDNVKTLNALSNERGTRFAEETLAIYAPFADRLGLTVIQKEMEDHCFKYLQPKKYAKITRQIISAKSFLQNDLIYLKQLIEQSLSDAGISSTVQEEYQTPYHYFLRSREKLKPETVHLDILTEEQRDCYQILGLIHEFFTPVAGSNIKDFIAIPRSNGYQALHTSLLFHENVIPVQIRTYDMDKLARFGILSKTDGWRGEGIQRWINSLKELVSDTDTSSFIRNIQEIAKQDLIYVCTPRGDYLGFPPNATILDFAYRIHTELGNHCASAFMDNQSVHIFEELRDGAMVEIVTSPDVHPLPEWLNKIKTPRARSAAKDWLDNQKRLMSHQFGKRILTHEMRRVNLNLEEMSTQASFLEIIKKLGVDDVDDLYTKLGRGIITPRKVISHFVSHKDFKQALSRQGALLSRFLPFLFPQAEQPEAYTITDIHDAFIKLSKCCNPLPGDEVIGILSVHHGLSVHRIDCSTFKFRTEDKDRIIKMRWQPDLHYTQTIRISIRTEIRADIAAVILNTLHEKKIPVIKFHLERLTNESAIEMEIESSKAGQAELLIRLLEKIKGVQKAQRI